MFNAKQERVVPWLFRLGRTQGLNHPWKTIISSCFAALMLATSFFKFCLCLIYTKCFRNTSCNSCSPGGQTAPLLGSRLLVGDAGNIGKGSRRSNAGSFFINLFIQETIFAGFKHNYLLTGGGMEDDELWDLVLTDEKGRIHMKPLEMPAHLVAISLTPQGSTSILPKEGSHH
ncbi:uncharacterized protein LOC112351369 [Selaginella moellendorffii]|uniref:uncharacterized protein LOC112351369 n=1 Tax=Selaginella moellendorffii TaxID=88036 RepID=UPI000D1CF285|nr:uncharacterized protein LOC112351369 [Selaginella moellendorffii]|eukprot:XP_024544897.1 uncharacterized protein LOC112351369 [Selaginella moellendorffii]